MRAANSANADQHVKQALDGISSKIPAERRSREEDFEKMTKLGQGSFGVVY